MRGFTRPLTLVLTIVCLAIAAPTSDVHTDPGSGAISQPCGGPIREVCRISSDCCLGETCHFSRELGVVSAALNLSIITTGKLMIGLAF